MKIQLIPKSAEEKQQFIEETIIDYAQGLAKANDLTMEAATERSKEQIEHAFNPQKDTIETKVVTIFEETTGKGVGGIWFVINAEKMKAHIYQIAVDEKYRGKGYGKAALDKLHDFCKMQNVQKIALSVFGWNTIAFELYKKLGYDIVQIAMLKEL